MNLPNWLPLTFRIDGGDWFDVDAVELLAYRQVLDIGGAVLNRRAAFPRQRRSHHVGDRASIRRDARGHVAALKTTIAAEDWSGTIDVRLRSMAMSATVWRSATESWPAPT